MSNNTSRPATTRQPALAAALKHLLTGGVLLLSAGCAMMPGKQVAEDTGAGNDFSELYDGKATTAYATELPVASAEEARLRGDMAMRKGDMDLALYHYIQALELNSKDTDTLNRIGAIHASRDKLKLAELAYRHALALTPEDADALTGLGLIQLKHRDNEAAKTLLTRSVGINFRQWRAHNALGIIADLESDHLLAISHYGDALKLNPDSPMLLNNTGYSHYLAEDWAAAVALFRQALDKNPDYKLAWQNLGLVLARQGNYSAAVDALSHAMPLSQAYNDVGYLSMLDGKYKISEAFLAEAVKQSPSYYQTANQNMIRVNTLKVENEAEQRVNAPAM